MRIEKDSHATVHASCRRASARTKSRTQPCQMPWSSLHPPCSVSKGQIHMRAKLYLLYVFLFTLMGQPIFAQTMPPTFSQHKYGILNYDLFVPSPYDTARKYPMIVYFHGYNDTAKKYFNWYDNSVQSVNPCFVLAPKCPPDDPEGWGNSWQDLFSTRMSLSFEVMDSLIKDYSIDTNRLYIYGTSMGGYGTFEALYRYPTIFAAAMVLCGGGNPATAAEVMKTPLWIFHGAVDNVVPISESRNLYDQMIALGAKKARFIVYPTAGHEMWNYAPKEPAWPDWIFNFTKGDTFAERPDVSINISCTKKTITYTEIDVSWKNVDNHQIRQNKIWYYKIIRNDSVIGAADFTRTLYQDKSPINGVNVYKMTAVNYDFLESDTSNADTLDISTAIKENEDPFPRQFLLSQNYPNPFNPTTVISYQLPANSFVVLKVYDVLGREVKTLVNEVQETGRYSVAFDAAGLSSGVYFYRLQAGSFSQVKKMILIE
jgi:predicted esterase